MVSLTNLLLLDRRVKKTRTSKQVGIYHGFRSGLEERIAEQLTTLNVPFTFEEVKIKYVKPQRSATYCPDFILSNGIVVETKGRFLTADRQKHILIKEQHPELDLRFVFSNSNARISKTSKTTYADWCIKNGFVFADKLIPIEWINETR
jgi:hypothetical protein